MTDNDKKIADIIKIRDCLSRSIDDLRTAEIESRNTGVLRQKQKLRSDIATALVPANAGATIAKKYDMLPNQKIGKYIDLLASTDYATQDNAHKAIQSDMIMLVVCSGILFGEYEFLKDLETKTKFSTLEQYALSSLGHDVDWVYEKLAPVLDELSNWEAHSIGVVGKISHGIKQFEHYYKHDEDLNAYDMLLKLNAKLNTDMHILSMLWYVLWASTNYRYENGTSHIEHDWTMKTMLPILLNAKKVFGDKYIIAPATNLWTNKTLSILDKDIMLHQERNKQDEQRVADLKKQITTYYDMLNPSVEFMNCIKSRQK